MSGHFTRNNMSRTSTLTKVSGEMSHLLPFCLEYKHNLRHPVVVGVGKNHRLDEGQILTATYHGALDLSCSPRYLHSVD